MAGRDRHRSKMRALERGAFMIGWREKKDVADSQNKERKRMSFGLAD